MRKIHEYFFDVETDEGFNGNIIYIHLFGKNIDVGFTNEKRFIEFIFTRANIYKNSTLYFYAHNGGAFDFVRLFPSLFVVFGKPKKIINRHGNVIQLTFALGKTKIIFKDTYALIPIALKKFHEVFNIQHKKLEIENISNLKNVDFNKVKEYCRYDTIVLYEGFNEFRKMMNVAFEGKVDISKKITLPSACFEYFFKKSGFKKRDKDDENVLPQNSALIFKDAYAGGRTEIFKAWEKEYFNVYDVNSMYPFVMTKFEYPISKLEVVEPDITKEGISLVKIYSQKYSKIPYTFFRHNGKLYFPVFDQPNYCIYTNLELREMKKRGYDFDVLKSFISEEKAKIFEYIEDMYNLRMKYKEEGNKGMAEILKLIMNSTYGKFGQNKEREEIVFLDEFDNSVVRSFMLDGTPVYVAFKSEYKKSMFNNYAIASYITAYARHHLYSVFEKCNFNVIYADTDSCFTKKKLNTGERLGDLKLERTVHNFFSPLPKVYVYLVDDKVYIKAKGFPLKSFDWKVKTPSLIVDYLKTIGVKVEQPTKFKKMLYNLEKFEKPFIQTETIKFLASVYDKRYILKNGETIPVRTSEIIGRSLVKKHNEKVVMEAIMNNKVMNGYLTANPK